VTKPGVQIARWKDRVVRACKEDGFITCISGRKRWLADINAIDTDKRLHAERQAINTICQGSAADVARLAMLHVERAIAEHGLQHHVSMNLQVCTSLALFSLPDTFAHSASSSMPVVQPVTLIQAQPLGRRS
jgi:DNA polymerase I